MEAVHAVLLLLAAAHCATAQTVYKVCASERVPSYTCVNLKKGNTEANCLNIADSAECARQLVLGNADLGVLTAEEVLLASKFVVNDDTRIIAEIRHEERLSEPFAFETVAIVRSNYNGLLANLKGKKLCHPGFSDSQLWTNRVLKHFERLVVPRTCNKLVPRIEEEYDNLASFFSQACIPGDWSRNGFRDKQLKAKHPELCALCDNPQRCSYNNHLGSHEAALACLTDRGGDVAYVALQYTKDYFGLGDRKQRANPEDYRYLCPNGTMEVIKNNARPCTWLRQPWNVVVARKDKATILQNKLKTWLPKQTMAAFLRSSKDTWQGALAQILFSESNHFVLVDPPVDSTVLSTYMARGRNETVTPPPSEGQQCRPSVRWCVSTPLEVNKCEVLKQGAFTFGLEPSIQCVTGASMWDCMAAVRNMTADILAIDSEYSHLARKTFGLAGLIYQDSDNDRAYKVVAVVRADSGIMQLSDLKKKSACFPEYGGLAWTAWVDAARSRKLLPRKCPSSVAAASYLYRACAPGADDNIHHPDGDANTRTALCALCPDNNNNSNKKDNVNTNKCAANSLTNGYFADQGAMRCLNDKRGDVAVIDLRAITEIDDSGIVKVNADYREDEYRVLCRNGSASTRLGLLVDSKCALSTGVVGEVVSRGPDEILSKDAALLLMELEYWFGFGAKHYESALNMFGQFRGTEDVIFKRAAVGFISIFDKENVLAREFSSLMDRNQGCNLEGGSAALSAVPVLVLGLVAAVAAVRRL